MSKTATYQIQRNSAKVMFCIWVILYVIMDDHVNIRFNINMYLLLQIQDININSQDSDSSLIHWW